MEQEGINKNVLKHLVNVDMIESYMEINNLDSSTFCKICEMEQEVFNDIINRQLQDLPYVLSNISNVLKVPFKYLVNLDILKDNHYLIFK